MFAAFHSKAASHLQLTHMLLELFLVIFQSLVLFDVVSVILPFKNSVWGAGIAQQLAVLHVTPALTLFPALSSVLSSLTNFKKVEYCL